MNKTANETSGSDCFSEAEFGMFIHWGLYAGTEGEWKGKKVPYIGEWIMHEERIPKAEYSKLAQRFNPVHFNAHEWVRLAEAAGMQYIVFTTKHYEGFAMLHSKVDSYNIVDATPFKRDVLGDNKMPDKVRERISEACITLNDTWGYKAHDKNWKSADVVRKMLTEANGKNTNALLNIGPQPDGRFPAPAIAVLKELAKN